MTCSIVADRLHRGGGPVPFVKATSSGGRILPELIVLHDTADRPTSTTDTINYFASAGCQVSAHFVVGRDGSITQMVNCDHKANHAGKSSWNGRQYCNGFSVGIEIDNPGKLDKNGRAWFHKKTEPGIDLSTLKRAATKEHGDGYWLPYTEAQIQAVIDICKALVAAYPTIKAIGTHWLIAPGRKIDTNPLFPLERVRSEVFSKSEPLTASLKLGSEGVSVSAVQGRLNDLGYGAGTVDGRFGSKTRAAVLAFEAENSLKIDGELDTAESAVLMSETAKRMPMASREEVTVADLAGQSRSTNNLTVMQKLGLGTSVASAAVGAVKEGTDVVTPVAPIADPNVVDQLSKGAEGAMNVKTIADNVGGLVTAVASNGWILSLVLGVAMYFVATRLLGFRLQDFKLGRYTPSGGK